MSACLCSNIASSDSGVICKIPDGCFKSLFLCDCATSPCQCQTGICASSHRSFRRINWSFISAFKGPMYIAPTVRGASSENSVSIGKNAASVLPDAVEADNNTFSSVLKIASPAATWIARRFSHLFRYIKSCTHLY